MMPRMGMQESVLSLAHGLGLGALARRATRRHLRILRYHGIWVTPGPQFGNCTFIEPEQFEQRMARLHRSGRPVLPLGEAVELLARDELPDSAVVITIDDGWLSTLTHMLPVLESYGLPATLYATSWYAKHHLPVINVAVEYFCSASGRLDIDERAEVAAIEALPISERLAALRACGARLGVGEDWLQARQFELMSGADLAEAKARGLDIQLHTHRHVEIGQNVAALPQELAENRAFLAAVPGMGGLDHFCFPSGSFHRDACAMLVDAGIRSATLCDPGLNAPGCDPLALRRLLDGRNVGDAVFDGYLDGTLHFASMLRRSA
jgi:peptidoglycan/xylan/chitin deacetylase (PgdA/CDA1 family)